jgi:hypothetical protein
MHVLADAEEEMQTLSVYPQGTLASTLNRDGVPPATTAFVFPAGDG